MKVLILNFDYDRFLDWHYRSNPGLESRSYDEQMEARNRSLFGVADFYSFNLRALGCEARELHVNNRPMQLAWAREHGLAVDAREGTRWEPRLRGGFVPWLARVADRRWMYRILAAQIERYRPDVVLNQVLDGIGGSFLRTMKRSIGMLVGQVAAPFDEGEDHSMYDLVISSIPGFVESFRRRGVAAELNGLAFEPRVLDAIPPEERTTDLSFVGSLSPHHHDRVRLLELLAERFAIEVWGKGAETLPAGSALRHVHRGEAWGEGMYRVLGRSRVTLNHHIGIAGPYANNMRLYEATGMGALLVTDWKENLRDLFEPGVEIAAYRSAGECADLVAHYLKHEEERAAVAAAGHARTMRDHTYRVRMEQLLSILEHHGAKR